MLKRDITYEDFDGNEVTETHYFNLNRTEILELEVSYQGGLEVALRRIIETNDRKQLIAEFQRIILLAYGVKSEDGKRFIKNDQVREEFKQNPAYDALFMDLATNDNAAAIFIKGVVPKDFAKEIEKSEVVPINPTGILPTAKD